MDPHAVLGLSAGATLDEAAEAYKRLAKRWHPDVTGVEGLARMTELNVAYELLRAAHRKGGASVVGDAVTTRQGRPRNPAAWLPAAIRRALGPELLGALEQDEHVDLVTPTATWASPSTLLAVTDRRLLWVLDDAVSNRVRFMRFGDVQHAQQGPMRLRRSRSQLRVQPRYGRRRWTFSDLRPATAAAIAGLVRDRARSGR
ncbi:MAG: J domain-containing protein [Solirubrobacteraceae bacterium]